MNSLKKVRDYLNSIPNINDGGCAIAALSMYRWLEKHSDPGYDCCIVYLYSIHDLVLFKWNYDYVNKNKNSLVGCSHAALYYREKFVDCQEYIAECDYEKSLILDIKSVVDSINDLENWCSFFQRSFVPEIATVLDIDLSDIKLRHWKPSDMFNP